MKKRNSTQPIDPNIIKKFIRIVLPIAGQNLLSSLVSASDALMLSGLNQSSLSAVSLATQISFVISLFYMSLTTGATILAAQYWGKGDISGIFCAGGDTRFGLVCDAITLWVIVVPIGLIAAFVLKLPVLWVYFLLNIDELIKLPAVYKHYKKYNWVKNITKE